MNVLMLSTDASILTPGTPARGLTAEYGAVLDALHVVVYTKPGYLRDAVSPSTTAYPTNTRFRPLYFWHAYRIGKDILTTHPGPFVITAQEPMTGIVGYLLKRRFGYPLQLQAHADYGSSYYGRDTYGNAVRKVVYEWLARKADCIRVVSQRGLDHLRAIGVRVPATLLPIRVDISHFESAAAFDVHAAFPHYNFIVVMAGRLTPEKDYETALAAFAKLCIHVPKAGLLIAGEGPLARALAQRAAQYDIAEQVVFLGHQDSIAGYLRGADAVLVTSQYEGYGRILIEAAAARCAIVTTDVGIVGDMFTDKVQALVCPVMDADCLSERLYDLVRDNALRLRLGIAAREAVEARAGISKEEYVARMKESFTSCGK